MRTLAAHYLLLAMAVSACAAGASPLVSPSGDAIATPSPTASPSPSVPSPESSAGGSSGSVIVTFRTAGDEEYRILLTDAEDIGMARRLLAGEEAPSIPNGRIVRGGDGGVNTGYSWHIDPESVEFADFTIELCDGRPSYVEDGTLTGDFFCPWTAEVVAVEPAG
jgi:hypothetical protein